MSSTTAPVSLMTRLNQDWAGTHVAREHTFGELGTLTCGKLLEQIRTTRGPAQDALLYPLITLARRGDRIAERVLVQVLIPAAQRMAHRVTSLDDLDRADRVGYAIGAAWESIRTYKLHLHARVHANLTMNMLGLLAPEKSANQRHIHDNTAPVSDEVLEIQAGEWEQPEAPAEVQLARLFTWALDTRVLDRDEIALLSRAALGEETHQQIADDLGLTVAAMRKRVDRIRGRLRDAARDQL